MPCHASSPAVPHLQLRQVLGSLHVPRGAVLVPVELHQVQVLHTQLAAAAVDALRRREWRGRVSQPLLARNRPVQGLGDAQNASTIQLTDQRPGRQNLRRVRHPTLQGTRRCRPRTPPLHTPTNTHTCST
jgi:hypothetical protein